MSLSASLTGAESAGGSMSSAYSVGQGSSFSDSWSRTYGSEATAKSYAEAIRATERQKELMQTAMEYNAQEAYAQRAFNEMMGNTIYTRSVKNMVEAGINPILAANMGLSGASVQSGAAASISTPSAFMGQTFADQASASHSESQWSSKSESSGSGWNQSESGLATGLAQLGKYFADGLSSINNALNLNVSLEGLKDSAKEIGEEAVYGSAKGYTGATKTGAPDTSKGYTYHYDSEKGKYLTEDEVKGEGILKGLYRGLQNKVNATLGTGHQK